MARDDPTIYMRIPAELKERLDAASFEARRSMTAEVVARLQKSFERPVIEWKGSPIPGRSEEDQRLLQIASRGSDMIAATLARLIAKTQDAEQQDLLKHCEELARSLAEATKQRETA